jgi:hypothetical protein
MPGMSVTSDSAEHTAAEPEIEGESSWSWLGGIALRVLLGAVLSAAIVGLYIWLADKPPVITGEVDPVTTFFIHRELSPEQAAAGTAGVHEPFDQVLVLANVRIHNQSKIPVFTHDMWAMVGLPDMDRRGLAAGESDFSRVFVAYPQMASVKRQPLLRGVTIPPHSSAEGQLIFNFPLTQDQWNARRSLDVTVAFQHQKDLTIHAPK